MRNENEDIITNSINKKMIIREYQNKFIAALFMLRQKQSKCLIDRWRDKQKWISVQWNVIQPKRGKKFYNMLQHGWTLRYYTKWNEPVTKGQMLWFTSLYTDSNKEMGICHTNHRNRLWHSHELFERDLSSGWTDSPANTWILELL